MDFITGLILMVAGGHDFILLPVGSPAGQVMQHCIGKEEMPGKLTLDEGRWKMIVDQQSYALVQNCRDRQVQAVFNQ